MSTPIFQTLLVADDGAPGGDRAASVGVRLGARLKAEVILLGIVDPLQMHATGEGLPLEDPSSCRRRLEERFERFLKLGRALGVKMIVELVEGRAPEQIRKRLDADHPDLILVGSSTLSETPGWTERSTAEATLHETTCSVMIVR